MSITTPQHGPITMQAGRDYRTAIEDALGSDIVRYYDECFVDYRVLWLNGKNLAIHYGYWDEHVRTHSQSLVNMNRIMAERVAIGQSDRVLDAGCGLGGSSIWLAENYGPQVLGITLAESQVRRARRYARKRGVHQRVEFEVADYCKTPFQDASFDVIWGLESICYAIDKRAFIAEAYRLLRPGGRLVVADGFACKAHFNPVEWDTLMNFLNGWAVPNLATPQGFSADLAAVGFQDMEYTDITENVMPSARRMRRMAVVTTPIQTLLSVLRIRTAAQTRNYRAALHQLRIFEDGISSYGLFSARK